MLVISCKGFLCLISSVKACTVDAESGQASEPTLCLVIIANGASIYICAVLQGLSLQHISNILWAYASFLHLPAALVDMFVAEIRGRLAKEPFNAQQLSNLLWSLCISEVACFPSHRTIALYPWQWQYYRSCVGKSPCSSAVKEASVDSPSKASWRDLRSIATASHLNL